MKETTEIFVLKMKEGTHVDAIREMARKDFVALDGVMSWETLVSTDRSRPTLHADIFKFRDHDTAKIITKQFAERPATKAFLAEVNEIVIGQFFEHHSPQNEKREMNEHEEIGAVIANWNNGLDGGDIEVMVGTCHENVVTVNTGQPITVGTQAIKDKYLPRIDAAEITSGFDIEEVQFFGDVAVVAGRFFGTMKDKKTGDVRNPEGRLVIVYKRDEQGAWKMILDMDNNGPA